MEHPFTWNYALGIPEKWQHVATSAFVMVVLLLLAWLARSALLSSKDHGLAPDGTLTPRNLLEVITDFISGLAESVIGHHSEQYVPLMCSFFLFILLCNFIGMIPGFAPPTSNFNITLALGAVSFLALLARSPPVRQPVRRPPCPGDLHRPDPCRGSGRVLPARNAGHRDPGVRLYAPQHDLHRTGRASRGRGRPAVGSRSKSTQSGFRGEAGRMRQRKRFAPGETDGRERRKKP